MRTATRIRRTAAAGTLACALLAPATGAVAHADDSSHLESARQQSLYYSSYGEPEPIAAPVAPVSPDDTPWLTIGLASAAGLATASLAAVQRRRLRVRREFGRVTAG